MIHRRDAENAERTRDDVNRRSTPILHACGAPIIGGTIAARTGGVARATGTSVAQQGAYEIISDLPAGTYSVLCTALDYRDFGRIGIIVTSGATTYVNFPLQPK